MKRLWKIMLWLAALLVAGLGAIELVLWHPPGAEVPPHMVDAPKSVRKLSSAIQGKTNRWIRWAILWRYGPADRDIGSGIWIEQWDLPEGILTMHSEMGPSFTETPDKRTWHLLESVNPLGHCLMNRYSMRSSVPQKGYWLGELDLNQDMTYHYNRRTVLPPGAPPADFYFMDHPDGKIEVRYETGITTETLLETLPQESVVARITFFPNDGAPSVSFPMTFSNKHRWLELKGGMPLPFTAGTGARDFGVTK